MSEMYKTCFSYKIKELIQGKQLGNVYLVYVTVSLKNGLGNEF